MKFFKRISWSFKFGHHSISFHLGCICPYVYFFFFNITFLPTERNAEEAGRALDLIARIAAEHATRYEKAANRLKELTGEIAQLKQKHEHLLDDWCNQEDVVANIKLCLNAQQEQLNELRQMSFILDPLTSKLINN